MDGKKENKTAQIRNRYHIRAALGALVLAAALALTAATLADHGSDIKTSDSSSSAQSSQAEDSSSVRESVTTTTSVTSSKAEQQTEKKTQPEVKAAAKSSTVSTSPKIEVRDGVTYVNDILIANKTYALPSGYDPGLSAYVEDAFNRMQQAAAADGIELWICSGYRSYSYQKQLYDNYVSRDGKAEADRYSARAGHSEHQTGLAVDVNDPSSDFDNTPEAKWLAEHCNDYGFIIRYKPGKESSTGYLAESWHIRYLGDVELCKKIEASGLSLEEYLGISSVYSDQ